MSAMIVYEFKAKGKIEQYRKVDEAIRTFQFVRNKALALWMDNRGVKLSQLSKLSAILASEFEFASLLNSQARLAATERASCSIKRFYDNCKSGKPGKKGYPKLQKNNRSVEYKQTGWKLSENRNFISFIDKVGIGKLKLVGTYDLHYYQIDQIKRVRIIRRSDGYYVQFVIDAERHIDIHPTGKTIGLDVGLSAFYTDSQGQKIENPRHLRKSQKALKRLQRRVSKKEKGSNNRFKAVNRLGRKHLKVSRQRKDFAVKTALCVVKSNDFVAFEKLLVRNMVKNHHLALSISDAARVAVHGVVRVFWQSLSSNCGGSTAAVHQPKLL